MQLTQQSEDSFTHGLLALALTELEEYSDATHHAQQAIHLAPDDAWGHYSLARVLLGRKRYDEARNAILEAIRLEPHDADYFGILANLELLKSRWHEALAAANQGLAIDPEHNVCTNMRAQALIKLGDRATAAATMGEALARRPDDALTHANQGWAMLHAGDPHKALEHFRESLRLEPDMEWARQGTLEALKARNFFYRWMLAWFLWMSRLSSGARWGMFVGGIIGQQMVDRWADNSPTLAPFLNILLYSYFAFVLMTWISSPFFNLLLRCDKFGKHVLSLDEMRGANVLAVCLIATLATLVAWLITGGRLLFFTMLMFALLSLPASAIYSCNAGWPRRTMAGITIALLCGVLILLSAGMFTPATRPPLLTIVGALLLLGLPWAMLGSQFAAAYLMTVTPRQ
jgi:tetratricopeptide (TPR) repeat protein